VREVHQASVQEGALKKEWVSGVDLTDDGEKRNEQTQEGKVGLGGGVFVRPKGNEGGPAQKGALKLGMGTGGEEGCR